MARTIQGLMVALGVSILGTGTSVAGSPDADGDGVLNWYDNCGFVANSSQCDSDADGFGNHCDGDLNQSGGIANFGDLATFADLFGTESPSPVFNAADFDCSGGIVNFGDLASFANLFGTEPGPAGFATYNDTQPIFAEKCQPCHTGLGLGGHNIGTTYADALLPTDSFDECTGLNVGQCAIVLIQNGEMPNGANCTGDPAQDAGNASCLTQSEQDAIQSWIDAGLPLE